jgi:tetratricopeptide (TPR) repeat protein
MEAPPQVRSWFRQPVVLLSSLVIVLVLGGLAVYWVLVSSSTQEQWKQATEALERHDLRAASEHLEQVLAWDSTSAEGHYLLARTLRREGTFDRAQRHLDEARRLKWDPKALRMEAGLAHLQAHGIHEMPTRELQALVQGPNPDRDMLEAMYRGDLATRSWDRAGLWLYLWLEKYPDDWAPRLWQAELLEQFKKYDQARADYLRVLDLCPECRRAMLGVGLIAVVNRGNYDEAESYLGQYLQRDPGQPEALLGLARCRLGRNDIAGARTLARQVLDRQPEHPGAALLLGTIEAEAEHDQEAVRWLRLGESADPQAANYQLAQVLRRLGQTDEAEAAQRKFADLREKNRATEVAARAADRDPNNAELQYAAGRACWQAGEHDAAAQWFRQALKLDPNHRASHAALAGYYARQTFPEAARRAELHRQRAKTE